MIGTSVKGTDNCYVCGNELKWEKTPDPRPGQVVVYNLPEISADLCAVGKNEDGTVKLEITCMCPKCRCKNRFFQDIKVR